MKHSLGKAERLKSRKEIDNLFTQGKRFGISPFRVYYTFTKNGLKFGTGVSAKIFKKSTDRNRIKRLIREAYRLQKNQLLDVLAQKNTGLHLFLIYTGSELPEYKHLFEKIALIIKRLSVNKDEKNIANI